MIVGSLSDIIRFSNITHLVAIIADLEIDDILAVAMCVAFDLPSTFSRFKGLALLKIHFTNVTIASIAEEDTTFDVFFFSDESCTGDLGENVGWLSACVNEIDVFKRQLDPWVLRVLDEIFGDINDAAAVEVAEEC